MYTVNFSQFAMRRFSARRTAVASLLIALVCGMFVSAPVDAKRWTVTQRLEKLSAEITEGRKANELTSKQVEGLQKDVADLKERMDKMKAKNGGQLSVPDTKKLHDEMTELSVKIHRQRLNNIYSD